MNQRHVNQLLIVFNKSQSMDVGREHKVVVSVAKRFLNLDSLNPFRTSLFFTFGHLVNIINVETSWFEG
jgi:hypothetical protein